MGGVIEAVSGPRAFVNLNEGGRVKVNFRPGTTGPTGPAAWTTPAAWVTATAYSAVAPASTVTQGGETYVCLISHTSGTFATDLGAGKWLKISAKGTDASSPSYTYAINAVAYNASATLVPSGTYPNVTLTFGIPAGPPAWQTPAAWVTGHAYSATEPKSTVTQGGSTYVCATSHTSGTFATDLGAGKWVLVAQKGADGAGVGDLVSTNNLSDVANASTARSNLGLAIGTNVQAYSAIVAALAGLTGAADTIPYFTGATAMATTALTSTARSLIDDTSTSAMRTTLGLGSLATASTINDGNWSGTDLSVANGGTGASTLTGILKGAGTSAVTAVTAPSGALVGDSDTQTLTGKRMDPRNSALTGSGTKNVNADSFDMVTVTGVSGSITFANPTGTPVSGQVLTYEYVDNGTSRSVSWGPAFRGSMRSSTTLSKWSKDYFEYNATDSKWDLTGSWTQG